MSYLGLIGLFGLIGLTGLLNKVHSDQSGSSIRILGLLGFLGLAGFWIPSLSPCGAFGRFGHLESSEPKYFTLLLPRIPGSGWLNANSYLLSFVANTNSPAAIAKFLTKFWVSCACPGSPARAQKSWI